VKAVGFDDDPRGDGRVNEGDVAHCLREEIACCFRRAPCRVWRARRARRARRSSLGAAEEWARGVRFSSRSRSSRARRYLLRVSRDFISDVLALVRPLASRPSARIRTIVDRDCSDGNAARRSARSSSVPRRPLESRRGRAGCRARLVALRERRHRPAATSTSLRPRREALFQATSGAPCFSCCAWGCGSQVQLAEDAVPESMGERARRVVARGDVGGGSCPGDEPSIVGHGVPWGAM